MAFILSKSPQKLSRSSSSSERLLQKPQPAPHAVWLWGFHTVQEALRFPKRKILRLWGTESQIQRLMPEIEKRHLLPQITTQDYISHLLPPHSVHQGLLLEALPLPPLHLEDLPPHGVVLILDQVTDPHNIGAILRTGAAFGVTALITLQRSTPALKGALAKSASGGLEHVPVIAVVNLARSLETLKDLGYQCIGLEASGSSFLHELSLQPPLALVLGSEGQGLRRLTKEKCDYLARLPLAGPLQSLNVSNACTMALTLVHHQISPKGDI